jgi:tagaturonate epimerase
MTNTATEATPITETLRPECLGLRASFGFGDRLGLATPGHVAALKQSGGGILPIFAQQSIREMTRTNRTPQQVMHDALQGAQIARYDGPHGADADHLKTPQDIERTAAAGFVFFTIDPSAEVDGRADDYSSGELQQRFDAIRSQVMWLEQYRGKTISLSPDVAIDLSEPVCLKAALKYGRAINLAVELSRHIEQTMGRLGRDYEIELSVDETPQPTTLAEHYIIADQCLRRGMKLVSLAPRFVGEFEKGVDFKGDRSGFERSLAAHAAIASALGPYKLSLHSGSDKLSVYPALARATRGMFHVKTAGTSYLEALRVVARHDGQLFRRIIDFSRSRYDSDRATYHVSATLQSAPPAEQVREQRELEKLYLGLWADTRAGRGFTEPGRQILHCTFGSVLTDVALRDALMQILREHPQTHEQILVDHFSRHLAALREGMP